MIKCGFSIENIQRAPSEYNVPVLNVRYRTIELYKTTFFNNFIFFSLKEKILKNSYEQCNEWYLTTWKF